MWRQYGHLAEGAAVSLYKQIYRVLSYLVSWVLHLSLQVWPVAELVDFHALVQPSPVFLYTMPSFFCLSPHPARWSAFLAEYRDKLGPCPPGINCCVHKVEHSPPVPRPGLG